jgi:hypothetical protein
MIFQCPLCVTELANKSGIYRHLLESCVNRHLVTNSASLNGPARLEAAVAVAAALAGGVAAPQPSTTPSSSFASGMMSHAPVSPYAPTGRGFAPRPTPVVPSTPVSYNPFVNTITVQTPQFLPVMLSTGAPATMSIPASSGVPPPSHNPHYEPNQSGYTASGRGSTPVVGPTAYAFSNNSTGSGRPNAALPVGTRTDVPPVNSTAEDYLPSPLYSSDVAPPRSPGKEYPDPAKFKAYRP